MSGFQNIEGVKTVEFSKGKAFFANLKINAQPNSEIFFKITSSSILRFYSEKFSNNPNISNFNLNNNYAYIFSIKFRKCERGEIFLKQINRQDFCLNNYFNNFFFLTVATNVQSENTV